MRKFHNSDLHIDYAEALTETYRYDFPSSAAEDAAAYMGQFILVSGNTAELLYGYISDDFADGLVELREANSSRDLSAAVSQICVDGSTSQEIDADESQFEMFEFSTSFDTVEKLSDMYSEVSHSETRKLIRVMQSIGRETHSESATILVPESTSSILSNYL